LAVAVRTAAQVDALARTAGGDAAPGDDAALRDAISRWASERTAADATRALLEAGVPAQPVRRPVNLVDDPQLRERGFFEAVAHPDAGVELMGGVPYRFGRTPAHVRLSAPRAGEHTRYVLETLLGLSEAEVEALRARGVVG
jgi:crotonobetainyl-CoA:carnitine CoA-transferase CaiB-like acyl-CoA transferase